MLGFLLISYILLFFENKNLLWKRNIYTPYVFLLTGIAAITGMFLIAIGSLNYHYLLLIISLLGFLFFMVSIWHRIKTQSWKKKVLWIFIYHPISLGSISFIVFRTQDTLYDQSIITGLFCLLWINDTFAFLSGKWLGKHKISPKTSPNKSWEGFIGGMFATLASVFLLRIFISELLIWQWIIVVIFISVFGLGGDLIESLLKRKAGVKDSGTLIPGHGGLFDRMDSMLLAFPLIAVYLQIIVYPVSK